MGSGAGNRQKPTTAGGQRMPTGIRRLSRKVLHHPQSQAIGNSSGLERLSGFARLRQDEGRQKKRRQPKRRNSASDCINTSKLVPEILANPVLLALLKLPEVSGEGVSASNGTRK